MRGDTSEPALGVPSLTAGEITQIYRDAFGRSPTGSELSSELENANKYSAAGIEREIMARASNVPSSSDSSSSYRTTDYYNDDDAQMIPYIDPTEAVLSSLPFGNLADSGMADMVFTGEIALPGFSGGGSGSIGGGGSAPVIASSLSSPVASSVSPWLIVALVVVAFLLFQQE